MRPDAAYNLTQVLHSVDKKYIITSALAAVTGTNFYGANDRELGEALIEWGTALVKHVDAGMGGKVGDAG